MIRIGLIIPANNAAIEYDLYNMPHDDMSFHFTRMRSTGGCEPRDVKQFKRDLNNAFKMLEWSDIIVYGRTYGTHKNMDSIIEILKNPIIPEIAVKNFLNDNNYRSVFIGTPYIYERAKKESEFFNDYNVTGFFYMNKIYGIDISNTKPDEIISMLDENSDKIKDADAIYIACTALSTSNILNRIRDEFNRPVISENSAILYGIERALDININIPGL
ncbi:aspartate racemase/maleate isomerase family protein [Picrophilus oshimae]|uniref:Maleate isomerase n=1 Tax=Picrophilus torridus (strain ATCC 700027 / DSM 9790 / JCM 10055 / NBRC 100828 / KAW 2/3) TaxID=1122961 RepID=A0A8G2L813_PICTO|nr:hypothetical protein [Picrophilus oshimae]SMD31600.1 maleate isomerase [Picrophilus oshimae DSM 9789]